MDIADLYHEAQEKYEEEQRVEWFAAQDDKVNDPFTGDFTTWLTEIAEPFMTFAEFCDEVEDNEREAALDWRYPNR